MSRRRLAWQVAGGLLVVAGAVVLVVSLTRGTRDAGRLPGQMSLHGFGEVAVRVTDASDRTKTWCLLAARTEAQRERGLMQVRDKSLRGHDGMHFQFPSDVSGGFWMRNTPMPLSIAYIDRAGAVVSTQDMQPCRDSPRCPIYAPGRPYRSAIEVPQGGLARLGIAEGSRVVAGGRCSRATPG